MADTVTARERLAIRNRMGIGNLRVHQDINKPFRILKYIIITRCIVRLWTEDRLLTVRSVDRCAPSAAIAPDHNAIPPVVLLLRSQCPSLYQTYTMARLGFLIRNYIGRGGVQKYYKMVFKRLIRQKTSYMTSTVWRCCRAISP